MIGKKAFDGNHTANTLSPPGQEFHPDLGGITFIMGVTTFIAIYAAYGSLTGNVNQRHAAQRRHPDRDSRVRQRPPLPTSTPLPTRRRAASATPETVAQAATQPPNNTPAPTATLLPVDVKRFQLGRAGAGQHRQHGAVGGCRRQPVERQLGQGAGALGGYREDARARYDWFETDTYLTAAAEQGLESPGLGRDRAGLGARTGR